ncbi:MAG: hypothetical protein IKZ95_04930, partial [Lachnospiraceae bacterium]|nr:hypothetical protein [Lachnospiraceae bacterium]
MKKKLVKMIGSLLLISMVLTSIFPVSVLAAGGEGASDSSITVELPEPAETVQADPSLMAEDPAAIPETDNNEAVTLPAEDPVTVPETEEPVTEPAAEEATTAPVVEEVTTASAAEEVTTAPAAAPETENNETEAPAAEEPATPTSEEETVPEADLSAAGVIPVVEGQKVAAEAEKEEKELPEVIVDDLKDQTSDEPAAAAEEEKKDDADTKEAAKEEKDEKEPTRDGDASTVYTDKVIVVKDDMTAYGMFPVGTSVMTEQADGSYH